MLSPTAPSPLEATVLTEALRARPGTFVALGLIAHAALWTAARTIADPTPAPEVLVGLALGRESQLGYFAGPPLAYWITDIAFVLGGRFAAAALLPALSAALAGWLVFAFARRVLGDRHGAIATLIMVGVHPVAFPVGAFSADLVQLPLVAGCVLLWWKATREGGRAAPYQFAAAVALTAYGGLQGLCVALTLALLAVASKSGRAALAGLLLISRDRRAALAGRNGLLALILAMLLVAPRFVWLVWNDFSGLLPAPDSGIEPDALAGADGIALQTLAGHIGLVLLVAVASSAAAADRASAPEFVRPPVERRALLDVSAIAVVPALLAFALGAFFGVRQPVTAASPLFLYSGVLVLLLAPDVVRIHRQRAVTIAALALLILPPALDAAAALTAPWFGDRGRPTNWPAAASGRYFTEVFRSRTGLRLEYVIGDAELASAIAFGSPDRPHVFVDADPKRSPWIDQARLRRRGAIVVWPVSGLDPAPPADLTRRLPPLAGEAIVPFNWVRPGRLDAVRLGWAMIPPQP